MLKLVLCLLCLPDRAQGSNGQSLAPACPSLAVDHCRGPGFCACETRGRSALPLLSTPQSCNEASNINAERSRDRAKSIQWQQSSQCAPTPTPLAHPTQTPVAIDDALSPHSLQASGRAHSPPVASQTYHHISTHTLMPPIQAQRKATPLPPPSNCKRLPDRRREHARDRSSLNIRPVVVRSMSNTYWLRRSTLTAGRSWSISIRVR